MLAAFEKLRQSAWLNVLVFLGYLGLAVVMSWPLVMRFGTELAGEGTDVWIHQWTFWWIKEALANGLNPFYTTQLYHPFGVSLTSHNIAWFNIAFWLPIQTIVGPVAAYNIVFLVVLALNGFALYLLAKAETGVAAAAFLGGLISEFWPYTFSHNDHPNTMVTFWVPLTMSFMLRTFRSGRVVDAVLTGISLALIGISRWQLLVMSAPLLFAYGIYLYYRESDKRTQRTGVLLRLIVGVGALLMVPLGLPLVLDQLGRSGPEAVALEEPDEGVTDLVSYVMPPDLYRELWDEIPDPLPYPQWEPYHRISASAYYVPFVGVVTLLLVLHGIWSQWSKTWIWLFMALGLIIIALGPELAINGQRYPNLPMPYRLIEDSLLDALIRRPHRLNNFLGIPVAMMAAWGFADIVQRINRRWQNGAGALLIALTIFFLGGAILWENPIPPLPTTQTEIPQWYQELAEEEENFAILEIPFHNRGFDKLYMYYQTIHGKPILVGHVSRLPQDAFQFLDTVPFLEPLNSIYTWNVVEESWVDFEQRDVTRQLELLAANNVRYIVLNKPLIAEGFVERWRDWVTFESYYEDDEVLVYRTAPQAGEDFKAAGWLADGIGFLRATFSPKYSNQGGAIKGDIRWVSDGQPTADYLVCFIIVNDGDEIALQSCTQPVAGWPTSQWGANTVARGQYIIPLATDFPTGAYTMEFALADTADGQAVGETATIGKFQIVPFDPEYETNLCWQGQLCLEGYDLASNDNHLGVNLYWQAGQPLQDSYKRFVHLIDPQDNRVMVQDDAVPRDWTYPTDIWEAGEDVIDRLTLPIGGIPAGEYDLRVGWYAVDGGETLPACPTGDCTTETAEFVTLTTIELPADD
jgi:hypothetical protein